MISSTIRTANLSFDADHRYLCRARNRVRRARGTGVHAVARRQHPSLIAAGSAVELFRLVHVRFGVRRWSDLDRLFALYGVAVASMDELQLDIAKDGMRRFGLGRGAAPAVLNFGDLFAYALARRLPAPLLFKGDNFGRTDVIPAWKP